jgi:hypothetical protein
MKKITNRSHRLLLARNGLDFICVGMVQKELTKATVGLKTMDERMEATLHIHQRLDAYREDLSKILGWGELPTCERIAILLEGYVGISEDLILDAKIEIDRLLRVEAKPSASTPHPYKLYYLEYIEKNKGVRHPPAAAAKAYFTLKMDKKERSDRTSKAGSRDKAIDRFVRAFKYRLE